MVTTVDVETSKLVATRRLCLIALANAICSCLLIIIKSTGRDKIMKSDIHGVQSNKRSNHGLYKSSRTTKVKITI